MKYKQISLRLPDSVLSDIDMFAGRMYKKRSEVIREAVLAYLGIYKRRSTEGVRGDKLLRKWMKHVVDLGPTNAAKEHDLIL